MSKKWFVVASVMVLASLLATSCAAPTPQVIKETVTVRETVPVEKVVTAKETVTVQRTVVVTATQSPRPTKAAPVLKDPNAVVMTVSKEQFSTWTRNFNPMLPDQNQRWPSRAGIYEPMLVYNVMAGEFVPWLATEYKWSSDSKKLTFITRDNVKWSDGQPFTARDVAYTFNLMKQVKVFDTWSVWSYLEAVSALDDRQVEFSFTRAYVPSLPDIGQQPIIPEHIWKDIKDPEKFTNDNPVATGPFTEVKVFQNKIYELGRNPNYWQEGKPYIQGLRFPAFTGNEQAQLALYNSEVDWAGNFIPDAHNTYAAADVNNHYWFPAVGGTIHLYVNTTEKPFDDPNVRKAISMAIDRQQIVSIAEFNYIQPADATGMSDNAATWKDPAVVKSGTWTRHDVAKANEMLDAVGLKKGADGIRIGPNGKPMKYDIHVVTGWDDWLTTVQIIADNLKDVGIAASVKTSEFGAWFDLVQKGNFDMTIGWSTAMPFPYNIYREKMSCETVMPIGQLAGQNWHRFCSKEADDLLNKLAISTDPAEQKKLAVGLERIFVDQAPSIPLFPGPSWGEFSTKRFVGWPDENNPYAKLTPNDPPGFLLILTNVKPR
jgi:peptide/nickel transport system substrate-binding protein